MQCVWSFARGDQGLSPTGPMLGPPSFVSLVGARPSACPLHGSLYLSMSVQLVPSCAQLLPTTAGSAPGPPTAPVHTKTASICRGSGSSGGVLCRGRALPGNAPASRVSHCSTPRCPQPSHCLSQPTVTGQPGGRDALPGRVFPNPGLVVLPITAAGSALRAEEMGKAVSSGT